MCLDVLISMKLSQPYQLGFTFLVSTYWTSPSGLLDR
jgi:hypothetical protein